MQKHSFARRPLLLLITFVLTTAALIVLVRNSNLAAQNDPDTDALEDAAAIQAVPIQIRPGYDGIALIDKNNYTMCIYQYQAHRPPHEALVLLATRSFRYDVQLEEYNTAEPRPSDIKELIEKRLKTPLQAPAEPAPTPEKP